MSVQGGEAGAGEEGGEVVHAEGDVFVVVPVCVWWWLVCGCESAEPEEGDLPWNSSMET